MTQQAFFIGTVDISGEIVDVAFCFADGLRLIAANSFISFSSATILFLSLAFSSVNSAIFASLGSRFI